MLRSLGLRCTLSEPDQTGLIFIVRVRTVSFSLRLNVSTFSWRSMRDDFSTDAHGCDSIRHLPELLRENDKVTSYELRATTTRRLNVDSRIAWIWFDLTWKRRLTFSFSNWQSFFAASAWNTLTFYVGIGRDFFLSVCFYFYCFVYLTGVFPLLAFSAQMNCVAEGMCKLHLM